MEPNDKTSCSSTRLNSLWKGSDVTFYLSLFHIVVLDPWSPYHWKTITKKESKICTCHRVWGHIGTLATENQT